MIERTIREHFQRELAFRRQGLAIKVLSLFFIDRVENYRVYAEDGARGLRLCVDAAGNRRRHEGLNALTVIADESFEAFAAGLQQQIEEDLGIRFGAVAPDSFAALVVDALDGRRPLGAEESRALFAPPLEYLCGRAPRIVVERRRGSRHVGRMLRTLRAAVPFDPFLLWLIATVAAASLVPVRGAAAGWADVVADLAIALLFFLHGAKLSRAAIVQGAGNWRLHLMVLATTYALFPAIGLAVAALAQGRVDPLLLQGFLYLTLLPSTVQSSIAFTAMARGNVAAAVCSASLSNLLGILLTPLLVGLFLDTAHAGGFSGGAVRTIALQLLLPFAAGHLLRPWIAGLVERNKAILQPVDRGSILLVVYTAFSAAVAGGIWIKLDFGDLLAVLLLAALVLGLVMSATTLAARVAGLARADAVVLFFCGSKKSLVSGVPMAGALFAPAQVGVIVLPLMIFHQLQLFLCAAMAARFRREAEETAG